MSEIGREIDVAARAPVVAVVIARHLAGLFCSEVMIIVSFALAEKATAARQARTDAIHMLLIQVIEGDLSRRHIVRCQIVGLLELFCHDRDGGRIRIDRVTVVDAVGLINIRHHRIVLILDRQIQHLAGRRSLGAISTDKGCVIVGIIFECVANFGERR